MQLNGWILVASLAVAPALARAADNPFDEAHRRLGDGVSLVVQGRYAEAEKPLRQALRDNPKLVNAHYNLGVALREQGLYDEAVAEYDRALALAPVDDEPLRAQCLYGSALAREARGDKNAWDRYLAFARPYKDEQPAVAIALQHRDMLAGIKVPGTTRKAAR
jgi:tetratricopeptide (TPR) repeat protein